MKFGNELHAGALEDKSKVQLDSKSKGMIKAMMRVLKADKFWIKLRSICKTEVEHYGQLYGTMIKSFLDLWDDRSGTLADLKTTNCQTLPQFLAKAFSYGYFRQAVIYMAITGAKEFYFVGLQKPKLKPNPSGDKRWGDKPEHYEKPKVFHLKVTDYPELLEYARQEVEWLLYYFNKHGKDMLKPKVKVEVV